MAKQGLESRNDFKPYPSPGTAQQRFFLACARCLKKTR